MNITKSLDWHHANLSAATFFGLLCFNSDPSVGTIPHACSNLTTSTSGLVASIIGLEVSDISASYTAHLDPWPFPPLLLLLPLPHHDPLVFLLKLGVLKVDRHNLGKWPCLLHLKQTDDAAGHSPTWCTVPHAVHSVLDLSGHTDC